jgi:hypothetical protein
MGYSTDFIGEFHLNTPLSLEHKRILDELAAEEHVPGEDGKPSSPWPCIYCQWKPTMDGSGIEWDGNEKFYGWLEWLHYIVEKYLKPWGHTLWGEVRWRGESDDDVGTIYVRNNQIEAVKGVNPGPSWDRKHRPVK